MKVWLFLESLKPLRWGIRYGKRWAVVRRVDVRMPMVTARGSKPPHGYLYGDGHVTFSGWGAVIEAGRTR